MTRRTRLAFVTGSWDIHCDISCLRRVPITTRKSIHAGKGAGGNFWASNPMGERASRHDHLVSTKHFNAQIFGKIVI